MKIATIYEKIATGTVRKEQNTCRFQSRYMSKIPGNIHGLRTNSKYNNPNYFFLYVLEEHLIS